MFAAVCKHDPNLALTSVVSYTHLHGILRVILFSTCPTIAVCNKRSAWIHLPRSLRASLSSHLGRVSCLGLFHHFFHLRWFASYISVQQEIKLTNIQGKTVYIRIRSGFATKLSRDLDACWEECAWDVHETPMYKTANHVVIHTLLLIIK